MQRGPTSRLSGASAASCHPVVYDSERAAVPPVRKLDFQNLYNSVHWGPLGSPAPSHQPPGKNVCCTQVVIICRRMYVNLYISTYTYTCTCTYTKCVYIRLTPRAFATQLSASHTKACTAYTSLREHPCLRRAHDPLQVIPLVRDEECQAREALFRALGAAFGIELVAFG